MISASKCRPLNSAGRFRITHPQAYQTACPPLQHILQHCLGENNLHQSVQCEYVELNGEPQTIADEAARPRNVGTYDGWNLVTTVSGEIRDPQRSLPIALMFGVGAVGVVYIAMNAALQFVMSASDIASSPQPASTAAVLVLGRWGAGIVSDGMALSMLVCLNGNVVRKISIAILWGVCPSILVMQTAENRFANHS